MKKTLNLTILAVLLTAGANAWAGGPYTTAVANDLFAPAVNGIPTPNSNTHEFEIYNAVNLLLGSSYVNNSQIDYLQFTGNDNVWTDSGNGGYAFIGLGAGNTNTLEVYDTTTPGSKISPLGFGFSGNGHIGDGSVGNPFIGTGSVFTAGTNFGFTLNSNSVLWDSNPGLNSDHMDHMLTYDLSSVLAGHQIYIYDPVSNTQQLVTLQNPHLLAFEDLSLANNGAYSDQDYNDAIFLVDGVAPATVPEPMTIWLFVVGLLAVAVFNVRRQFAV